MGRWRIVGWSLGIIAVMLVAVALGLRYNARRVIGGRADGSHLVRIEPSPQWREGKFRKKRPRVDGPFLTATPSRHSPDAGPTIRTGRCGRAGRSPVRRIASIYSGDTALDDTMIETRFDLAMHGWAEPIERVLVAAKAEGVLVATPRPGERFEPALVTGPKRWWPALPWKTAAEAPAMSTGVAHLMAPPP